MQQWPYCGPAMPSLFALDGVMRTSEVGGSPAERATGRNEEFERKEPPSPFGSRCGASRLRIKRLAVRGLSRPS